MLHPAMSSSRRFYSMVPRLARRFRVIRVDTRGHGASQIPPDNLPVNKERLMQDAVELLDHLKLPKVHLIGVSAGGYVAQQLAIHHPDRIKSLVLFCSTPGFKGEQGKRWLRDAAIRGMRAVFGRATFMRHSSLIQLKGNRRPFISRMASLRLGKIAAKAAGLP